jgi:Bacterial TSP3 repeat
MMRKRRAVLLVCSLTLLVGALVVWRAERASAQVVDPCAAATRDSDHDGLTNCAERRIQGTSARNWDTDGDSIPDGREVAMGTDPNDADSDHDGLNDDQEERLGTDPLDSDSDDDGVADGDEDDPGHELASKIAGSVQSITCPTAEADGSVAILGIPITLTADTEYDGVASCDDLAAAFGANGGASVEVKVSGDATTALVAEEVELKDGDGDGRPDDVDDDDDEDEDD